MEELYGDTVKDIAKLKPIKPNEEYTDKKDVKLAKTKHDKGSNRSKRDSERTKLDQNKRIPSLRAQTEMGISRLKRRRMAPKRSLYAEPGASDTRGTTTRLDTKLVRSGCFIALSFLRFYCLYHVHTIFLTLFRLSTFFSIIDVSFLLLGCINVLILSVILS